jgi:hypothetical protein
MDEFPIGYVSHSGLPKYRNNNKPEVCPILNVQNTKLVVDHDHKTGRIRGIISSEGNVLIGKIENFFGSRCSGCDLGLPSVLRRIAEYLEQQQGPYHPVGIRQLVRRFWRMPKDKQVSILEQFYSSDQIRSCKNSISRAQLYRKTLIGGGT